jgi:hypothetical protein
MGLLQTRFRNLIACVLLCVAAVLLLLFFNFYSRVLAAKRAVLTEDAKVHAELHSDLTPVRGTAPVVVELFTSEGCSSCPPADALLARLDREQPVRGADIIILEEHVDYWDYQGWKDRFSSAAITERQKQYQTYFKLDDIYTPQSVVSGSAQFNGADAKAIETSISRASSTGKPLSISAVAVQGNTVRFALDQPVSSSARVFAALVDPEASTEVHAGENGGRTLHHAGVVRTLTPVTKPFVITAPSGSNLQNMRLVVFTQTKPIGPILAATSCSLESGALKGSPQRCPISATHSNVAYTPAQ